jgi:integrase
MRSAGQPEYRLGKLQGRFVVAWWEGGRRRRFRLDKGLSLAEARAELTRFIKQRERLVALDKKVQTVSEIYQAYIRDRQIDNAAVEKHLHSWKALSPHFGALRPDDIDKRVCSDFQKSRCNNGRSLGTVWTDLSCLRAALNWAQKKAKIIPVAPFIWLPQQPQPRERYLTRDEAERLLDAAVSPHIRLFILLALGTGGRATALLELKWSGVDFERRLIDLRTAEQNQIKRRAIVPMNATLLAALTEAKTGALTTHVIEWAGRRLRTVKRAFARSAQRAGLADVTPHTLRHTAAVWMAEAGVPMSEIAQYLGHADSRLTERVYARYSPDHLRKASEALEMRPVRRLRK